MPIVQTHNSVLHVLIESGLVGLLAALVLLTETMKSPVIWCYKRFRDRGIPEAALATFSLLIGISAFSMVDGLIYHCVPLFILCIVAQLFVTSCLNEQQTNI
jgi:O-antigen ligase